MKNVTKVRSGKNGKVHNELAKSPSFVYVSAEARLNVAKMLRGQGGVRYVEPVTTKRTLPPCYGRLVAQLEAAFRVTPIGKIDNRTGDVAIVSRVLAQAQKALEEDAEGYKVHRAPSLCDLEDAIELCEAIKQRPDMLTDTGKKNALSTIDALSLNTQGVKAESVETILPIEDAAIEDAADACSDPWEYAMRLVLS